MKWPFMRRGNKTEKKRNLRQSTFALFSALLFFFCGMFLISSLIIGKKMLDDFKIRTVGMSAYNAASTVKSSLTNYNYLTRMLMVNEKVVEFLKSEETNRDMIYEARHGIYEIQNLYNYIDSIYLFRMDGEFVGTERNEYIIDRDCIENTRILDAKGSLLVGINGNGIIRKSTDEPLLTLYRSVYDINSQELIGTLFMNISGKCYEDTILNNSKEDICILNERGEVLCGDEELAGYLPVMYEGESIRFSEITVHGRKKTLAVCNSAGSLLVMSATDTSSQTISYAVLLAMTIPFTAFIISMFVCGWFLKVNISKPIYRLSTAMKKTKSCGWMETIDTDMPNEELETLALSYNAMIGSLQDLFQRQMENEKKLQRMELSVLQEQMKPHFLYNTLETLSYMAMSEKAPKTYDALECLGNFYRNFLNKGDREIALRTEIRIVQDYLSLQKLRYGDTFEDTYDIAEETLDCMIPKLILQPLVENSIYHGIRPKGEPGTIQVSTGRQGEDLHIVVYDTGLGMEEEKIHEMLRCHGGDESEGRSGFGLVGTIERIRCFCNREDVVEITSEPGEYTRIEIRIPSLWNRTETEKQSCIE